MNAIYYKRSRPDRRGFRSGTKYVMPRQARIDAPGALHHVIVQGIARRRVFNDDATENLFKRG